MGKYIRTMAESLSMVHEVTNMDLMRKAAGGAMQTLKMKDGKVQMDSFTASAIMQIYDKVNDKNKKTMENMLKTGRRADIMKLQKFAMSKINAEYVPEELDEQLEEKIDPADVDDDATEDDIKSADKNIMMQMRKVQSLRGRYAVEFMDGKKVKVDPKIAMAVQDKYMKMRRPAEKEMFQSKVARSYKDMLSALKESLVQEGTWKVPETKIDQMALRKTLRKPIKAKDAEKVMSQHIGDDALYDEFYELEKDDPNQDVRPFIRNRMIELGIKEEIELDEALPPHLAKFVDKKGNLKKDAADRVRKGRKERDAKITDRTPKGYGPNEQMDPRDHVEKTLDGKYAIVAPSGKLVKTFDDKKEAEDWVIINHDAVMKEEVPTNSAGGGAIAGLDIGLTHKKKQEDEKKAKALKKMMVGESVKMATFAGKDVFIVDSDMFHNCRMGKKKYHRYEKYVGSKRIGQAIREYGLKFPKRPIILQNGENGPMLYLRYGGK